MPRPLSQTTPTRHTERVDWGSVEAELAARGAVRLDALLSKETCLALANLFGDQAVFLLSA